MKKIKLVLSALITFTLSALCTAAVSAETLSPSTGNTEQSTYIVILIVAGMLVLAAVIAGIFTKKKK
ncbi:MAG: hypothetical protein IJ368_02645 [Oscillospiraceae bacterium]|nr:hypothetical protein [Oscillospiraceae bacterium]